MPKKFTEGKKYYGRSIVDSDTKIVVKIVKRTPTTVTIKNLSRWPLDQDRFKIRMHKNGIGAGVEYIRLGRYSFAPFITAENTTK